MACRGANANYKSMRRFARLDGARNKIVPADRSRAHLLELKRSGTFLTEISRFTGIHYTAVRKIASGDRPGIRERREKLILAVRASAAGLMLKY